MAKDRSVTAFPLFLINRQGDAESAQEYVLKKCYKSLSEAQRLAQAKIRQLNLRQTTGTLTVTGNPLLSYGAVIGLDGFGSFDGNFIIDKLSHDLSANGYICSVDVR